jgi:hypothetical protein
MALCKINFNVIITSMPRPASGLSSHMFQLNVYAVLSPTYMMHVVCTSSLILFTLKSGASCNARVLMVDKMLLQLVRRIQFCHKFLTIIFSTTHHLAHQIKTFQRRNVEFFELCNFNGAYLYS